VSALVRHGAPVGAVSDLFGPNENDLTAALAFVLGRPPALLESFVSRAWPQARVDAGAMSLAIEVRGDGGRIDLEIRLPHGLMVVEAKRDWLLPTTAQLAGYAPHVRAADDGVLVSLSQASQALARAILPAEVDGIPVRHVSWSEVLADLRLLLAGTWP